MDVELIVRLTFAFSEVKIVIFGKTFTQKLYQKGKLRLHNKNTDEMCVVRFRGCGTVGRSCKNLNS